MDRQGCPGSWDSHADARRYRVGASIGEVSRLYRYGGERAGSRSGFDRAGGRTGLLLSVRADGLLRAGGEAVLLRLRARPVEELRLPVVEETAWAELRGRLRSFVARRVSDPLVHDDLVQEILLRLHRGLPGIRDGERLDAFAYQIARNAIIDHHRDRSSSRERAVPPGSLDHHAVDVAPGDEDESGEGRAQLARCLRPLVDRLDDPYRQALLMTDLGDLSQVEAARRLAISAPGMRSRVQRGRAQVREALSGCCSVELDAAAQIADVERVGPCACD